MPEFTSSPDAGLWALFVLVFGDSVGVPVPGDSALIIAGGLAADGTLSLPAVIVVATIAAFIGDLVAFEIGRRGGRRVLEREGRFARHRQAVLTRVDRFYSRYGLVAVFFAKFIPGVRSVSSVAAGATSMSRRSFAAVDGLACVIWTSATASIAYAVGPTGALLLVGVGLALSAVGLVAGWIRQRRKRAVEPAGAGAVAPSTAG